MPLDVRGAYRAGFILRHPYRSALGADHFARIVLHMGVFVLFYDDAKLSIRAEGEVNRFGVGREPVRADLDDRTIAAALVAVRVAGVGIGDCSHAATKLKHEAAGIVRRSLTNE